MEDLLRYYERELVMLRRLSREFAERFPKVAAQLRLGGDGCEDPQTERLIESVALLAARVSKRLDDDYPQLTEALLEILFPHYLRPFPSCAIVRAESLPSHRAEWHVIPRGTEMESAPVTGVRCKFRSAYDVAVGPLRITAARFDAMVDVPAGLAVPPEASATMRLSFELGGAGQAPRQRVRVFMDGEPSFCAALRDALFMHTVQAYVEGEEGNWLAVPQLPLAPVGFSEDETLIPFGARSQPAYRLLTEYFAFPDKFDFFDIDLAALCALLPAQCGGFTLHLVLSGMRPDSHAARMLRSLSADNLLLGCTPVINLFSRNAEPIPVTQTSTDYAVLAHATRAAAYEVYSVDSVAMLRQAGDASTVTEFRPFYSLRHGEGPARHGHFWMLRHDDMLAATSPGYEKRIALVDGDLMPLAAEKHTLSLQLTCTNRHLPSQLRDSGAASDLALTSAAGSAVVRFVRRPTQSYRFALGGGLQWRLISHLVLNQQALAPEGLPAFREMLTLYDLQQSPSSQRQINGVCGLEHAATTAWLRHRRGASLVHGLEVRVTVDEEAFVGGGLHLFAQVIAHFLGLYVQVNSFVELVVLSKKSGKELVRCKPRSGHASLV
jgi:type VI secretion system protein ImpG